jgi:hypothetical protein
MEQIEFDYPAANRHITKKAHVGVVGRRGRGTRHDHY